MGDEKFGIENLKKVVTFGVNIGKSISADLSDGKISLVEVIGLLPELMAIPDLIASKDAIIQEAKDLSLDEVSQLVAGLEGVTSENIIGTINDALNLIVAAKNLVERFTNKPAAQAPAADGSAPTTDPTANAGNSASNPVSEPATSGGDQAPAADAPISDAPGTDTAN